MSGGYDMHIFALFIKVIKKVFKIVNIFIGQIAFTNAAGFLQNVIGKITLIIGRMSYKNKQIKAKEIENATFLKNNGFLLLDNIVSVSTIRSLKRKFTKWCEENKALESQYRLQASSADSSVNFLETFPEAKALFTDNLERIIEHYYQCDFDVINIHIYRTRRPEHASSEKSGGAYGGTLCWHSDGSVTDTLKVFFLLSEVTDKDGPMLLFDKNSSKELFRKYVPYNLLRHGKPSNPDFDHWSESYTGKIGRCLIVDTNRCLHRASVPTIKPRYMITFYIGTKLSSAATKFGNINRTGEGFIGRFN